jgi:predicted nuclease with TOPRIM domain
MENHTKEAPEWYKESEAKLSLIPDIQKTVQDTNTRLNELTKTIDLMTATLDEHTKELDHMKKENMELKMTQTNMQQEIAKLKQDLIHQETQSRRNNLLFAGFKEEFNENCEEIIKTFLREKFGIILMVMNFHLIECIVLAPNPQTVNRDKLLQDSTNTNKGT